MTRKKILLVIVEAHQTRQRSDMLFHRYMTGNRYIFR